MPNYMPKEEYLAYLKSKEWKRKRRAAIKAAGRRCTVCGFIAPAGYRGLTVHHKTYANIGNEPLEDLEVLCKRCHDRFHLEKKGRANGQSARQAFPQTSPARAAEIVRQFYDIHPEYPGVSLSKLQEMFDFSPNEARQAALLLLDRDDFGVRRLPPDGESAQEA